MSDQHVNTMTVEPGEIEAHAREASEAQAARFDAQGRLIRSVITTADFLAGSEAQDYMTDLPRGEIAVLGTVAGEVTSADKRPGKFLDQQGQPLPSYWLNGTFQAVIAATGEVLNSSQVILPRSYGVQVFNAFRDLGVGTILLGCTVGLRHRKGNIPYEWVVRDHMQAAAAARVAAISERLQAGLPSLPSSTVKQIAKPKNGGGKKSAVA